MTMKVRSNTEIFPLLWLNSTRLNFSLKGVFWLNLSVNGVD